jgi:two-component system, OmpR family, phosphate regulon sensor histidine kinase PhoR
MNSRPTTSIIAGLIGLSLLGLIALQVYLIRRAALLESQLYTRTVNSAMQRIVGRLETQETIHYVRGLPWNNLTSIATFQDGDNETETKGIAKQINIAVRVQAEKPKVDFKNDRVVLVLDKPEHVIIKTVDSTGQVETKLIDEQKPAGRFEVPIKKPPKSSSAVRVHLLSDTTSFWVEQLNNKRDSLVITAEKFKEKKWQVNRVIDELVMVQSRSVMQRVRPNALDSLVHATMNDLGIHQPYAYGIVNSRNDSILICQPKEYEREIKATSYRTPLFPNDVRLAGSELRFFAPQRNISLYRSFFSFGLASALLVLVLVLSLVYIIRTLNLQKRFSRRLVEFINNMTHEFKTPITTISLASETMQKSMDRLDPIRLSHYSRIIQDESRRMRSQVEKILQMAALEQRDHELAIVAVHLHDVIKNVVESFLLQVERREGKIELNLSAADSIIQGDLVHMQNVLNNLVDNAIKYTRETPAIRISTANVDKGIEVVVEDNGIGLAEDEQKRIFEKFYRVDTGNLHDVKGFGIGLSYVNLIVDAHGGRICVKSAPGQGCRFILWMPISG